MGSIINYNDVHHALGPSCTFQWQWVWMMNIIIVIEPYHAYGTLLSAGRIWGM